ncbi:MULTISPECIES: glycosyltransferase family 2 protein [Nocardioides]|uniref:Glycosyltransferase family 2 protein n=1 Tax=Nocardioides vastitatis TaxID=2568655 RepID=A0ABW0ZFK7_9ACTN|nr:glycosyltransferase [Nocardioides sp.]THJ06516.1 glycosyltransferase [Nocardioides sp.]
MPKVSVVIPTYRSGPGLDDAVASLDAQTLPREDFEVLLVDDGSPDDTFDRARAICATRPHFRAVRIAPSGWPSRPRNVGITEADGEFVLFMDHDDQLYPDSLRAAYALGAASGADVVNAKEVRTRQPRWGLATFAADLDDASELPLRGLLPMTPHKLYRRRFLLDHDIRFPEAPRHLWEDLFFNVDVIRHDPKVAVLSSVAFYHWRDTGENSSAPADGSKLDYSGDAEYWAYLDKLLEHVSAVERAPLRDELLVHNAGVRLASQIGQRLARAGGPERAAIIEHVSRLLATVVPPELDAQMPTRTRIALTLFRAGHVDEATEYLVDGDGAPPLVTITDAAWAEGALTLSGTVQWQGAESSGIELRREPQGLVRAFSPALRAALDGLGLPAAPDLEDARLSLVLRHKSSYAAWELPTDTVVRAAAAADGTLRPVGTFTARLDPARAAAGTPLPPGPYVVHAVGVLEGRKAVKRVRTTLAPDVLGAGRPLSARVTEKEHLVLRMLPTEGEPAVRARGGGRRRLGRGR